MRRNCPHCGTDQVVADEKLTAGWIFLKCHHCARTSAVQGKATHNLARAAEKPLRAKRSTAAVEKAKPHPVPEVAEPPRVFEAKQPSRKWSFKAKSHALPVALALICFGSGGYLLHSAKLIRQGGLSLVSDEAPIVTSNAAPSAVAASAPAPALALEPVIAPVPAPAPALAPRAREEKVQVRAANAVLRSGPGTE